MRGRGRRARGVRWERRIGAVLLRQTGLMGVDKFGAGGVEEVGVWCERGVV